MSTSLRRRPSCPPSIIVSDSEGNPLLAARRRERVEATRHAKFAAMLRLALAYFNDLSFAADARAEYMSQL